MTGSPNDPGPTTGDPTPDFRILGAIPVVPMLDEPSTRAFYVDALGFEVDWEHRFHPTSPLYMQVRLGRAILHLDGHATPDTPTAQVRIPVVGLPEFCEHLRRTSSLDPPPRIVDPRGTGEGTDLNLRDPSGNLLTFWVSQWSFD